MTSPKRPRPPSSLSARERIAARRAARRSRWRTPLIAAGIVIVVLIAVAGLALRRADRALTAIQQDDPRRTAVAGGLVSQTAGAGAVVPAVSGTAPALASGLDRPVNILLIGVDKRQEAEEGVRSDTLILVHLDPQAQWASMLSIPRDSIVQIPHIGQAKINTAYGTGYSSAEELYGTGTSPDSGGSALAAETVEQFLHVRVDYTAQVDFHGFAQLVDVVGGVLVDVQRPLFDAEYPTDDYGVERIYIPAGLQVLDGHTALIYARSRHSSSDFDRSQRQQQVLRALLSQVKSRGLLANVSLMPQWAEVLAQNIRTTLPVSDLSLLSQLAAFARNLDSSRIMQLSINPNDVGIDVESGSDIVWNQADVNTLVARWLAGPTTTNDQRPTTNEVATQAAGTEPSSVVSGQSSVVAPQVVEQARVQVLNGATMDGVATNVSAFLRTKGFTLDAADSAPQTYEHTVIIDYTGRPQTRQRLADTLGLDARFVQATPAPDAPPSTGADILVVVGQDYQPTWVGQ